MVDVIRLFAPDATMFLTGSTTMLGLGVLADASKCEVVEERNGSFELEMDYPISGQLYKEISFRSIIVCKPNPYDNPQAFRVYDISRPINGIVTIKAEHISYDLVGYPLGPNKDDITYEPIANVPFEATNMSDALSKLRQYSVRDDVFTDQTPGGPFNILTDGTFPDLTTDEKISIELPNTIRSVLGGDGGIVQKFKGELKYDNYQITICKNRGLNRGVVIAYGKNLTDLRQEANNSNVYTHIYPYWHNDTIGYRELAQKIVPINQITEQYPYKKLLPLDLSSMFEVSDATPYPTDQQMLTLTQKYITDNGLDEKPVINLTVSFEDLAKYPEFQHLVNLEVVKLCDTVKIQFPELGVDATANIIRTTYNVLTGKYSSIDIGEAKSTLTNTIAQQVSLLDPAPNKPGTTSVIERMMYEAGQKIAGNRGGYIALYDSDGDGEPDELLITSSKFDDIHAYTGGIWRWNYQGLAFSETGYDQFPDIVKAAITNDGQICADFIGTGKLQSIEIQAGTPDAGGNWPFHLLPNGTIEITKGEIKMGTKYAVTGGYEWPFHVYNDGKVVATDLHINGGTISVGNQFYVDDLGRISVYSDILDPEDPETVLTHQKVLWTEYGGKLYARELTANGNTKINGGFEHVIFDEVSDPELNNVFKLSYRYDDTTPVWAEAVRIAKTTGITVSNFGGIDISGDGAYKLNSYNVYTGSEYVMETGDPDYPYEYAGCRSFMSLYSAGFGGDDTFVGKSYWYYDTSTEGMEIDSNRRIWLGGSERNVSEGEQGTTIPYIYYAEKTTGQGTRGDTLFRLTCGDYLRGGIGEDQWNEQVTATDDFPEETFQASGTSIGGIVQINLSTGNIGVHKKLFVYDSIWLGPEESKLVPANWSAIDSQLSTTSENPVMNKVITARMNEVFQSVSNGKAAVASAITDKGVPTASDATFNTMANNIRSIPAGEWDGSVYEEANMKDYYSTSDDDINGGFIDEITIEEVTS